MTNNDIETGILIFDTNPTCAKVYVNDLLYGSTEPHSLQIMNVKPGKYSYALINNKNEVYKNEVYKNEVYKNEVYVESNKITHIHYNFKLKTKKEEIVKIGTPITNYYKLPPSIADTTDISDTTNNKINNKTVPNTFGSPFDNGDPILKDEPITISKHTDYYDVSNTITVASTADPKDFDSTVYNKEEIFKIKGRYSERILVKNDGFIPLYVIVAHGTSTTSFSNEVPIYSGEIKVYYNVYSLRLRSSVAGHPYRVMEYDLQFAIEKSEQPKKISTSTLTSGTSFDQALSTNQIQTIHLTGLAANKIKITAVNGQSKQNLKYRLIFWSSSTTYDTNLDLDKYVTDVIVDFSDDLSAFQIDTGAGLVNQYYLDVSGLDALYEDDDSSVTLHVSLQNLSETSKLAGENGAVQFDFKYVMKV